MIALAGFHIKRQEFEPEYDNEAEMIIADMEFKEDDTQVGPLLCSLTLTSAKLKIAHCHLLRHVKTLCQLYYAAKGKHKPQIV